MAESGKRQRRLSDGYSFAGFRAKEPLRGVFGDPDVRILRLNRRSKKRFAAVAGGSGTAGTTGGQGSTLHQGPEVQSAIAPRKPHPGGQALAQDSAGRQQAPQHCLRPQGGLRPTLGLRARGLGAALLRQLESQPQMAAPRTLRALCRYDRSPLGRHRRLLQTGKQGLARLRRRPQQQNPRLPETSLRTARRRISPPQGSHLHAAAAMIPQNRPLDSLKTQTKRQATTKLNTFACAAAAGRKKRSVPLPPPFSPPSTTCSKTE